VVISVDSPEESLKLARKQKINFPLLSDPGRRVISKYGVADADADIAVPSVFLVGKDGTIQWRHVGEFIGKRPLPRTLLEEIDTKAAQPQVDG